LYQITLASTEAHINGIHTLQKENLKANLSSEEISSQGFVTCDHGLSLLSEMNTPYPHVICTHEDKVVGYALTMLREFRDRIEVLVPMFEKIDTLTFLNSPLKDARYYVMGQICVAKGHRGQGLFDRMYDYIKSNMADHFDYCITEIATENLRSRAAHKRVGFSDIHTYIDPSSEVSWEIVGLNLC